MKLTSTGTGVPVLKNTRGKEFIYDLTSGIPVCFLPCFSKLEALEK
jgi:hypothetical protein